MRFTGSSCRPRVRCRWCLGREFGFRFPVAAIRLPVSVGVTTKDTKVHEGKSELRKPESGGRTPPYSGYVDLDLSFLKN